MKLIAIVLFVLVPFLLCSQNELIVRINAEDHPSKENVINAWIEIFSLANKPVKLADQNYRLYYDSDLVTLIANSCQAVLPKKLYSELQLVDHIEGAQVFASDSLNFSRSLGFVNVKIDLIDSQKGGKNITSADGWTRIALLSFKILDKVQPINLIWAQPDVTDNLATAFVEITEWVNPWKVQPFHIHSFINGHILPVFIDNPIEIEIRPNPIIDYMTIRFDHIINQELEIRITDLNGNIHQQKSVEKGEKLCALFCADMPSGLYLLELISVVDGSRIFSDLIAKVN